MSVFHVDIFSQNLASDNGGQSACRKLRYKRRFCFIVHALLLICIHFCHVHAHLLLDSLAIRLKPKPVLQ